jgi:hypothetical protein
MSAGYLSRRRHVGGSLQLLTIPFMYTRRMQMKKPKEIAIEKISSLPDNVSFGRILQAIIHLKHTELLALEEWIPTPKQSSEIEKMCKKFTKPELTMVAQECGLDLSKCGGDYKVLIATSITRKGLSFDDVERIHTYKKKLKS